MPFNIVKNIMIGDASNTDLLHGTSMVTRLDDELLTGMNSLKKMKHFTNKTREYLIENNELMDKCREIAFSFDWIFTTLWIMSPTIEEAGPAFVLPFGSFQSLVCQIKFNNYSGFYLTQ